MTYVEVIRQMGVVVTLLGASSLAPAAMLRILDLIRGGTRRAFSALRHAIAWLTRRPLNQQLQVPAIVASFNAGLPMITGSIQGHVWPARGTVDERIEALRRDIVGLQRSHADLRTALDKEREERAADVASVLGHLDAATTALRARLDAEQERANEISYHGVYVLLLGTLIAGFAGMVAALPRGIGILALFAVAGITHRGCCKAFLGTDALWVFSTPVIRFNAEVD